MSRVPLFSPMVPECVSRQANSVLIITPSLSSVLLVTEIRFKIIDMALIAIHTAGAFIILSIDMGE